MRTPAPALLPLFRSELQARILARLLLVDDEIGISDLARAMGAPQPTVHREASRLIDAGVLVDRLVGRTRIVSANRANPAYRPLRELIEVVYGPSVLLRAGLANVPGINVAFIYGSWAARYSGHAGRSPEDIDLLIVGAPDPDALHSVVTAAESRLHREVNYVVVAPDTWVTRASDPFLTGVDAGPTVIVAGDEQ